MITLRTSKMNPDSLLWLRLEKELSRLLDTGTNETLYKALILSSCRLLKEDLSGVADFCQEIELKLKQSDPINWKKVYGPAWLTLSWIGYELKDRDYFVASWERLFTELRQIYASDRLLCTHLLLANKAVEKGIALPYGEDHIPTLDTIVGFGSTTITLPSISGPDRAEHFQNQIQDLAEDMFSIFARFVVMYQIYDQLNDKFETKLFDLMKPDVKKLTKELSYFIDRLNAVHQTLADSIEPHISPDELRILKKTMRTFPKLKTRIRRLARETNAVSATLIDSVNEIHLPTGEPSVEIIERESSELINRLNER